MPLLLPATLSSEAQQLEVDRLVKLYVLDATAIGGQLYRFCSSVDASSPISAITTSGSTVTVDTITPHAMATGDLCNISGVTPTQYNGDHSVKVVDANTFTFNSAAIGLAPGSGNFMLSARLNNTMLFDGHAYSPVAFSATGFEWNGQGSLPLPKIQVSNVNQILQQAVITLKDLVGATFMRIRTLRKHLDDGTDPDPTQIWPVEVFRVNRKTNQNRVFIEWELAASLDQEDVKIPGRQAIQNACTHRYRFFNPTTGTFDYTLATCPYVGNVYFTTTDTGITDPSQDACSKLLTGCRARFGIDPLPTRAFPGIANS